MTSGDVGNVLHLYERATVAPGESATRGAPPLQKSRQMKDIDAWVFLLICIRFYVFFLSYRDDHIRGYVVRIIRHIP
jgi:hypothetical protein